MIDLPEGAAFYLADAADRAAVRVMSKVEDFPADLDFEELESFGVAQLTAFRVKVDLWRMLRNVWRATWGAAVETHLPDAKALSLGEHENLLGDGDDYSPTFEMAWDEKWSGWGFSLGGGVLLTGVRLSEGGRLDLIVYSTTAKGDVDEKLDALLDAWKRDDEEFLVFSGVKVAVDGGTSFDEAPLKVAAEEVCALIAQGR
jgi:hypothetical protein